MARLAKQDRAALFYHSVVALSGCAKGAPVSMEQIKTAMVLLQRLQTDDESAQVPQ